MDADGGNPSRLKNQPEPGWTPAWSPDGKRIAFTVVLGGNYDIYILNVDGRDLRRITRNMAGDYSPAWHPDGHTIVFWSMWQENHDIYRIEVNRVIENRLRLTRHPEIDMGVPTGALPVSRSTHKQPCGVD